MRAIVSPARVAAKIASGEWRVGRKVGRTLYLNDQLVGMMDTPELAQRVVDALNATRASVYEAAAFEAPARAALADAEKGEDQC